MNSFIRRIPVVKFLIPQIFGILAAVYIPLPGFLFWLFFILFVSILFTGKYQFAVPIILFLILFYRTEEKQQWEPFEYSSKTTEPIIGVVEYITKTANKMKYELLLQTPVSGEKAILRWSDSLHVFPGDTLLILGKILQPEPPRNPGAFDYGKYLKTNRISFLLSRDSKIEAILHGNLSLNRWYYSLRLKINHIIHRHIDKPFSGVMLGLVLGEKGEIDPDIISNYQKLGVVHILAVSGLHVGYVLLILMQIGKLFRMNDIIRFILICGGLIFYMGLTGYRPSVVRAGIMAILYAYGKYGEKTVNTWNILGCTAFILLLVNPMQLYSAGFQLSFGAVTGILFTISRLPLIEDKFNNFKTIRKKKWVRYLTDGVTGSFGAQLGTFLPLAIVFKSIPVWGVVVNVFIIPIAGLVVVAGFVTVLSGFISSFFGSIYGHAGWGVIWLMNKIALLFDFLPNQTFYTGLFTTTELAAIFIIVFLLWNVQIHRYRVKLTIAVLVFGLFFLFNSIFFPKPLSVTYLDVGQGDSAVIEYEDKVVLIDAGFSGFGKDYGNWVLNPYFKFKGISEIDLVIMTHPHADHIGGLLSVLTDVKVVEIWDTWNNYKSAIYTEILNFAENNNITLTKPLPGDTYTINNAVITVLYPDSIQSISARNINDASIVCRLDHRENTFLFMGDAEVRAERIVTQLENVLEVDVVKLGHHGSKTSSIQPIVDLTNADIGIISVGRKNKYGHPSEGVMTRWINSGTTLYRTDISGAVTIKSDGKNIQVSAFIDPQ